MRHGGTVSSRFVENAEIRHVAMLAELSLSPEEEQRFAADVGRILAYVAELDAIDTSGVPPTAHLTREDGGAWRGDDIAVGLSHDDALANAPRVEEGGFAVPAFVE